MYVGYCISGIHGRSSLNPLAQEALRPLHRAEVEASSMCWRIGGGILSILALTPNRAHVLPAGLRMKALFSVCR